MYTNTNDDPALRVTNIHTLMKIASERPTILLERLLALRIEMQSAHRTSHPMVLKIRKDDADGKPAPVGLMSRDWISTRDVWYCALVHDQKAVMVIPPDEPTSVIAPLDLSDFGTKLSSMQNMARWWDLDLQAKIENGEPLVTLCDQGPALTEWASAMDEVISSFRREGLHGFEATYADLDDTVTPDGFREALQGFPEAFVQAMHLLAGDIDNLVGHLAPLAGNSQEEREFENCDEISKACIGALVPGIRTLKFHGFGWPALTPEQAKAFLGNIRQAQPAAVDTIWSLQTDLNPQQRDELISFLLKEGVILMDGSLVSVAEPADFFATQVGTLA